MWMLGVCWRGESDVCITCSKASDAGTSKQRSVLNVAPHPLPADSSAQLSSERLCILCLQRYLKSFKKNNIL